MSEKRLLKAFARLAPEQRLQLCEFAEFLAARSPAAPTLRTPLPIERPAEETVVAAMRRLSLSYPMLEAERLLHGAAGLLAEHTLQGRAAGEVIDELEALFLRHFQELDAGSDER